MKTFILHLLVSISLLCSGQTKHIALTKSAEAASGSNGKISLTADGNHSSTGTVHKISLSVNGLEGELGISEVDLYEQYVTANNGTISDWAKTGLKRFVGRAKTHGYWDKLLTVNALAGDQLNAALVQLKSPAGGEIASASGFTDQDYSLRDGLHGTESSHLYTRTSLSGTNGIGGYHIWVGPNTTGTFGVPNHSTPYSILVLQQNQVVGYYSQSGAGTAVNTASDNYVELVKQSLTSLKLFINEEQRSASTALTEAVSRADEISLNVSGNVWFYAIDDGTLSDLELNDFQQDVRQLMYDLGRKLAPPLIDRNGLYTETQSVAINIPENAQGAIVHYTLDGTEPTLSSPVYTSPITISTTTRIKAITEYNGYLSNVSDAWVSIVPPSFETKKYYTTHVMVNLTRFTDNMEAYVQRLKDAGYNLVWANVDAYYGSYPEDLKRLMDAAEKVGIPVIPGLFQGGYVTASFVEFMKDTWDHPALFRIDGKRCYTAWDYLPDNQQSRDAELLAQTGISKSDYYMIANSRFPISYDGGKTFVGESTRDGITYFSGTTYVTTKGQVHRLYDLRPFDGYMGFLVDMNKREILTSNTNITKGSREEGKFSFASVDAFYASVQFRYVGFNGMAAMWDSILAIPVSERANGVVDLTANDAKELSYIGPMARVPVGGIAYMPHPSEGFDLGSGIRQPWLDHSGPQAFARPWVDAFLNNQPAPEFTKDRMFAWYWLHPRNVPFRSEIPEFYQPYLSNYFNQSWWDQTIYARGSSEVSSMLAEPEVANEMDSISFAAHLSAPAQLMINNTLSPEFPAGAAYFKIARGNFLGTPAFSIVREGNTVMTGYGLQPIVNDVWPGGWNYLSTEIPPVTSADNNAYTATQKLSEIRPRQLDNMQVYPNPADEQITLEVPVYSSGNQHIRIFDAAGKMVHQKSQYFSKGKNVVQVSVRELARGVYTLKVFNGDKINAQARFIKR